MASTVCVGGAGEEGGEFLMDGGGQTVAPRGARSASTHIPPLSP